MFFCPVPFFLSSPFLNQWGVRQELCVVGPYMHLQLWHELAANPLVSITKSTCNLCCEKSSDLPCLQQTSEYWAACRRTFSGLGQKALKAHFLCGRIPEELGALAAGQQRTGHGDVPEQLLWEEAGSSRLCNPLDAGCASGLQPVTEAITGEWGVLPNPEKGRKTRLCRPGPWHKVSDNLGQCEAGDLRHYKLMRQEMYQSLIFPSCSCPWSSKTFPSCSFAGKAAVLVLAAMVNLQLKQQRSVHVTVLRSWVYVLRDELEGGGSYSARYINLVLPSVLKRLFCNITKVADWSTVT